MSIFLYQDGKIATDSMFLSDRTSVYDFTRITYGKKLHVNKDNTLALYKIHDNLHGVDDDLMMLCENIARYFETAAKYRSSEKYRCDIEKNNILANMIEHLYEKYILPSRREMDDISSIAFFTKNHYFYFSNSLSDVTPDVKRKIVSCTLPLKNSTNVNYIESLLLSIRRFVISDKLTKNEKGKITFCCVPLSKVENGAIGALSTYASVALNSGFSIEEVLNFIVETDSVCGDIKEYPRQVVDLNKLKSLSLLKVKDLKEIFKFTRAFNLTPEAREKLDDMINGNQ